MNKKKIDTSQFDEDFIKKYNEENDEGFFLEVDVQYTKKIHKIHNDLLKSYIDLHKDLRKKVKN